MSRRTLITILAIFTGLVHLVLLNVGMGQIDLLFTLNGLGFLTLLYAYLNDIPKGQKTLVRWAFIGFSLVTVVAYFAVNGGDGLSMPLGLVTKAAELGLAAVLRKDR